MILERKGTRVSDRRARRSAADTPLPGMDPARPRATPPGYVERAFLATMRKARAAGAVDYLADALAAQTRDVARAIDRLTPGPHDVVRPYDLSVMAQLTREYRANVEALGLVPTTGGPSDEFAAFLDSLAAPTRVQDAPDA